MVGRRETSLSCLSLLILFLLLLFDFLFFSFIYLCTHKARDNTHVLGHEALAADDARGGRRAVRCRGSGDDDG